MWEFVSSFDSQGIKFHSSYDGFILLQKIIRMKNSGQRRTLIPPCERCDYLLIAMVCMVECFLCAHYCAQLSLALSLGLHHYSKPHIDQGRK